MFVFAVPLTLLLESILLLELEAVACCLSFPLPVKTALALSSDDLAASIEPRGVLERSTLGGTADAGVVWFDVSPVPSASTRLEDRLFDFDSLACFLACAFASFSFFLRRSSSSSMDRRIASMTMSSSRLQKDASNVSTGRCTRCAATIDLLSTQQQSMIRFAKRITATACGSSSPTATTE